MDTGGVEYIPKKIALNFEMTVLHEHKLGWKNDGDGNYVWRSEPEGGGGGGFPFGTGPGDSGGVSVAKKDASVQRGFDPNTPATAAAAKITD